MNKCIPTDNKMKKTLILFCFYLSTGLLTGQVINPSIIKNELEEIEGIGEKTAQELLTRFRSVTKIKLASKAQLTEIVGLSKATIVYRHFHEEPI